MDRLAESIATKLEALTVFLGGLGALLVLLGITNGFQVPGLKQLTPNDGSRWIAVLLGIVLIVLAIGIQYRPPQSIAPGTKVAQAGSEPDTIPDELRQSFADRETFLTTRQRMILDFLYQETARSETISQDHIEGSFAEIPVKELYFRLEQLRLLGFLQRQKAGFVVVETARRDRYAYRLSPSYEQDRGRREEYMQATS